MNKAEVIIYRELSDDLLQKWQELWNESNFAHFHNSPSYFIASCKGFLIKDYLIITVEENGQLEVVFPLVWEKRFGIKTLCNPGERFTDKSTLLIREKKSQIIKVLVSKLMEFGNLYLEEFPEEIADMLTQSNHKLLKQKASANPYLPLQPDPFQYVSKKNRSRIINKIKKDKENFSHNFAYGDINSLEIAFEVDKKSMKRARGTSDLGRERERAFFRTLLKEVKENFRVDIISYKGVPVIYSIGFIHKKTYHAGITSFDKDYFFLSPGKILQYYLLNNLAEEKKEMFDFSRGLNEFKKEFTPFLPYQYTIIYAKQPLIVYWWQIAKTLYNFIFESKFLYGTYLIFKKRFWLNDKSC